MEKIKLKENSTKLIKVELNNHGDYVAISADDSTLLDRFVAGYKRIVDMSEDVPKKLNEVEKKYEGQKGFTAVMGKTAEMSKINVVFSEEAAKIVDGIFGEGTIKKYFHDIYEEIPNFLPDVDCFVDFLEQITPEMEKLFGRKIKERNQKSRERMAKYQPHDYKKPVGTHGTDSERASVAYSHAKDSVLQ